MKWFRLLLAMALVSVFVSACTSPTAPPIPTPDDGGQEEQPPPNPGFHLGIGG